MSTVQADTLLNSAGTGAPSATYGVVGPTSQVASDSATGFGSGSTQIRKLTNHVTVGTDITAATDATLGTTYTINAAGVYVCSYSDGDLTAAAEIGISLNSAQLTTAIDSITVANRMILADAFTAKQAAVCVAIRCAVNDVIRPHCKATTMGNPATGSAVQFRIVRII